jgi:hypothetical protein
MGDVDLCLTCAVLLVWAASAVVLAVGVMATVDFMTRSGPGGGR